MLLSRDAIFPWGRCAWASVFSIWKALCRLDQMCSWGLCSSSPQVRGTSLRFVSEWAERMGEVARSPIDFRTSSVPVPCEWLAGCPPAALPLAQLHMQALKVFSHVDPVYLRSLIKHPHGALITYWKGILSPPPMTQYTEQKCCSVLQALNF